MIDLRLHWTGKWENGFKLLTLDLRNNGKPVDSISVLSGYGSRQDEPFIHPSKDWAGSGRPIPEGVYSIGKVERGQWGSAIGNIWASLPVQAKYRSNNRGAFGFHDDANRDWARGSAGCIVTRSTADLKRLTGWLESDARPDHLVVDWGLGFLASRGYSEPGDPDADEWLKPDEPHERDAQPHKISDAGLAVVKHFEGLHRVRSDGLVESYLDPVGIWTIGYGHTRGVYKGQVITKNEAERLLQADMSEFETAVRRLVTVPLTQAQFDALVSFSFNVGSGALGRSTLLRKLNSGNYAGASQEFPRWSKAGGRVLAGLERRRQCEKLLFLTGQVDFGNA